MRFESVMRRFAVMAQLVQHQIANLTSRNYPVSGFESLSQRFKKVQFILDRAFLCLTLCEHIIYNVENRNYEFFR